MKVKIPRDRDGRPKQFAFVNFKHEESVPYGLSLLNGIKLYGRPIKIQFRSGTEGRAPGGAERRQPPPAPAGWAVTGYTAHAVPGDVTEPWWHLVCVCPRAPTWDLLPVVAEHSPELSLPGDLEYPSYS